MRGDQEVASRCESALVDVLLQESPLMMHTDWILIQMTTTTRYFFRIQIAQPVLLPPQNFTRLNSHRMVSRLMKIGDPPGTAMIKNRVLRMRR